MYQNVRDDCHYASKYRDPVYSICNLKLNKPNQISEIFLNGSNCGYYFIEKELTNEFEGKIKGKNFFCSNRKISYKNR